MPIMTLIPKFYVDLVEDAKWKIEPCVYDTTLLSVKQILQTVFKGGLALLPEGVINQSKTKSFCFSLSCVFCRFRLANEEGMKRPSVAGARLCEQRLGKAQIWGQMQILTITKIACNCQSMFSSPVRPTDIYGCTYLTMPSSQLIPVSMAWWTGFVYTKAIW